CCTSRRTGFAGASGYARRRRLTRPGLFLRSSLSQCLARLRRSSNALTRHLPSVVPVSAYFRPEEGFDPTGRRCWVGTPLPRTGGAPVRAERSVAGRGLEGQDANGAARALPFWSRSIN